MRSVKDVPKNLILIGIIETRVWKVNDLKFTL